MSQNKPVLVCRQAIADDLEAIIALLADDVLGRSRNPLYADAKAAYDAAFAEMADGTDNGIIVGFLGGRMVGCYQLTFIRGLSHTGGLRAQIESVRIAADLRGIGLGSALMHDAIARARAGGVHLVQLTTDTSRPHTRAFYERLGFTASHHGMKLAL
jgi:ribosomal protein S18 acetylase RimI-like enzyme